MSEFILHHYDASPFSEKIRLMMGYKSQVYPELKYHGVDIPVIMPKPTLMPLTGGYRRTPVAQVGADIYCDTALITRLIDRLYPNNPLVPQDLLAVAGAASHWTDTFFFKVCVAMAFQPKAMSSSPLFSDPEAAAAFMADRAEFSKGSSVLGMDFSEAQPHWLLHMKRLDKQLGSSLFLHGNKPVVTDFSTYHCLWFVQANDALKEDFEPFSHVLQWMNRMGQLGHGNFVAMQGSESLEIAKTATPSEIDKESFEFSEGCKVGDAVNVTPSDYGFQPTSGTLVVNAIEEIAVRRVDSQVGEIIVHFPRLGFKVEAQ